MKNLERAVSAQAELIASLRRRIEILDRKPPDQRPRDLAGILPAEPDRRVSHLSNGFGRLELA